MNRIVQQCVYLLVLTCISLVPATGHAVGVKKRFEQAHVLPTKQRAVALKNKTCKHHSSSSSSSRSCHKHKMPFGAYGTSFTLGNLAAYGTLGFGPDGVLTGGASNADIGGGLVDTTTSQIIPDPVFPSGSGWGIGWVGTFKRVEQNHFVVLITNLLVDKGADPALPGAPTVRVKIVLDLFFSRDLLTFTGTFTATTFPLSDLAMSGPPLAPPATLLMDGAKIQE